MSTHTTFEQQWLQGIEFKLPDRTEVPVCPDALLFQEVCAQLQAEVRSGASEVQINLALYTLQIKFNSCFESAPAACRGHFAVRRKPKVRCLWEIYRETYQFLYNRALKLTPPPLREPPSLPPPPLLPVTFVREKR
jgi:hypothetical protein